MKNLIWILFFAVIFTGCSTNTKNIKNESNGKVSLNVLTEPFSDMPAEEMKKDLEKWTDKTMAKSFVDISWNDDFVKDLYSEFKGVLVTPPNPDNYKVYEISNAEESLKKVETLGRKIWNLLSIISDKDYEKYGQLMGLMSNVLAFDARHIPLAIKHDNGRDVYWYELHNNWVKQTEKEFKKTFSRK